MKKLAAAGWAMLTLASCAKAPELSVGDGYVRLPAVAGRPAAGYFTITGGPTGGRLLSISSAVAIRTEMHETRREGGVSRMVAVREIAVPANGETRFRPGGLHAMLFSVNAGIKPGSGVPMTFSFGDGRRIQYRALAIAASAPAPE